MGKTYFPKNPRRDYRLPEARNFESLPEKVTCTEEELPYNKLAGNKRDYALFTDGSCHVVGNDQRWKASLWSPE